jgi:16S rRNA (guanine966-N2)-methyltransferase
MSRGAASAILVDADRKACACIEQNLEKTRLKASVICSDVFRFLKTQPGTVSVDLIFADPPYAKRPADRDFALELLREAKLPLMLHSDGMLILEIATAWKCPELELWEPLKRRKYGSTEILFLKRIFSVDSHREGTDSAR